MSSLTFSCNSNDCYASVLDGLITGTTAAFVAGTSNFDDDVRNWIPFTVTLPRLVVISSAILRIVAETSRSETTVSVQFCCENVDTASAPADVTAMFAKSLTTARTSTNLAAYTAGTEYSYDVTSAVQEVIARAGWATGNVLAVMIVDNGTGSSNRRTIATSEHATLAEPKLDITFTKFVPRGGMI